MTKAMVSIITHSRPKGLERLLVAIAKQKIAPDHEAEVLVVDNACDPNIRALVEHIADGYPFRLIYEAEPQRGIVAARNKCVDVFLQSKAECLLFIDDDSWPAREDWIETMLNKRAEFGADLVAGPEQSLSGEGTPEWANHIMHDFSGRPEGAPISTFYTSNLLISKPVLEEIRPAFDNRFRMSGGSDYHFSLKCTRAGFRAVYVNAPVV